MVGKKDQTGSFIRDIYSKRSILYELVKRDYQKQYMGSYLGFIWIYLQPLLFITILYLVFTLGFRRVDGTQGVPFAVYLISGIIAWFHIASNLSSITTVIKQYDFLIKKVNFQLGMLPVVKLLSSSLPHVFFIIVALLVAALNNIYPTLYTLQIIYYFCSMSLMLLGIGWLTSSTNVFVPDVSKVISIVVTFGFWLTPIFWNLTNVPKEYRWLIKLNPAHYIIEGYRDSIYNQIAFWEKPIETIYYWALTTLVLWVGTTVFKNLKPHFAEVT